MKNKRYRLSVLAIALSFLQTPPVTIYAEKANGNNDIETAVQKQGTETPSEAESAVPITIRSIFLESETDTDPSLYEDSAVMIAEKEIEVYPEEKIIPDFNLRASENDEFALNRDGAIMNEDHYHLSHFIVSGNMEKDLIQTELPVLYTDEEEEDIQISLVYIFIQPWHFVTIHYEDMETGEELFEPEIQKYAGSSNLKGPVSYDVKQFIKIRFDGYRFRGVSGDTLLGDVSSDKEIHILYEKVN